MNQKDAIKWGLILLGAYLVYKYIEEQGGISAVLGQVTGTGIPVPSPTQTQTPAASVAAPSVPILDVTGLTVVKDINNSLKGTVKIKGVPTSLAIIQPNGGVYNDQGQEVTNDLAAEGVDLNQLRAAFTQAGAGLGMFAPAWEQSSAWMQ